MVDCLVATCEVVPQLDPDDRLLLRALREQGLDVGVAVWTDPSVDWSVARLCLLRSTWDYPKHYARFCEWLESIEDRTVVRNPADLLRWNGHKGYLLELERAGVPIVPTALVRRGGSTPLVALLTERGWHGAVVKPAVGSAAFAVHRVSLEDARAGQAILERLLGDGDVLVQPYLRAVETYAERALVYVGGEYSHAVCKRPFDVKLRIESASEGRIEPTAAERELAARTMTALPGGAPLYARVDILRTGPDGCAVSEVELIEPALYFGAHPPAADALAGAVVRELDALARVDRRGRTFVRP